MHTSVILSDAAAVLMVCAAWNDLAL